MLFVRENHAEAWNDDACLEGGATREQNCGRRRDQAVRAERTSIATLAVGGALVATGIVLMLLPSGDDAPDGQAVACHPIVGSTTGGSCAWRF